ncbi:hypothetical protein FGB62_43g013 [Gracilaria domingensis]|nr:hypothetical protein FGB62_43g013 [Gracilaria domingensis]
MPVLKAVRVPFSFKKSFSLAFQQVVAGLDEHPVRRSWLSSSGSRGDSSQERDPNRNVAVSHSGTRHPPHTHVKPVSEGMQSQFRMECVPCTRHAARDHNLYFALVDRLTGCWLSIDCASTDMRSVGAVKTRTEQELTCWICRRDEAQSAFAGA